MKFKNIKLNAELYIFYDGYQEWLINDSLHRLNNPAVICPDGYRCWFQVGKFYRIP